MPDPDTTAGVIPIADAERIGRARGCPLVIVLGIEGMDGQRYTITTWGQNRALCNLAASFGQQLHNAIQAGDIAPPEAEPTHLGGHPRTTRHPPPPRLKHPGGPN